jgi:hypothetical protein
MEQKHRANSSMHITRCGYNLKKGDDHKRYDHNVIAYVAK